MENRRLNMSFVKIKSNFQRLAYSVICFSAIICLLLTLPAKAETDPILAEIGEHKITLKDLENKVLGVQERFDIGPYNPDRGELLLEMVRLEVFAKEALVLGLEKDAKVKGRISRLQNNMLATEENLRKESKARLMVVARDYVLATEYLQRELEDKINIDDEEILRYFKENRSEYMEPEKIRARQIYIGVNTETETKTKIDEARKKAERILERLKDGEDFVSLAREFSEDFLTKDVGGDLGYFSRGRLVPELEEPVFHLGKGQISSVLKSKGGFHIFKLEDRIERRPLEYQEARERIMNTLKAEKRNELLKALEEKLFKKYEVKIYKDRIPPTPLSLTP